MGLSQQPPKWTPCLQPLLASTHPSWLAGYFLYRSAKSVPLPCSTTFRVYQLPRARVVSLSTCDQCSPGQVLHVPTSCSCSLPARLLLSCCPSCSHPSCCAGLPCHIPLNRCLCASQPVTQSSEHHLSVACLWVAYEGYPCPLPNKTIIPGNKQELHHINIYIVSGA